MSIPELFIRRPVATVLVMFGILLVGVAGYRALPVSDLPNVDYPTIQVQVNLPGANPDTMAAAVALPLEKQFSTIAGLDSMSSQNFLGKTNITMQFVLNRDIDGASQDVQAAITQASRQLPQNLPAPPAFYKVNPADFPVLFLVMSSPTLPLSTVDEYAETLISQSVSTVNGVAQVQVWGGQKFAVRAQVDPQAMATRQIGIDEVEQALEDGNVSLPTGTLWGPHQAVNVEATGQLFTASDYAPLIVAYRNGSPVRLSDVGRVINGVENDKTAAWYNGVRGIQLAIYRQPGTNAVEVVDNVKAMLPTLQAQLPPAVSLDVLFDRSITIRNSVEDVKFTLELALILVVMVIFLFLRNVPATTIPSLALPFSIVGTFAVMYLCGYSLDNFSMMALTLSVGFVVDDAIVVLENIVRHLEKGEGVLEAALNGSNEIGFTIMSMTLSLAAVFLPVLFMGGVLGRLLHEFSVTIMSAILVSGFVSLTLTPMMCSRFLRPHQAGGEKHGSLFNLFERIQQGMTDAYDRTLQVVLRHKLATMAFSLALLVGTVYLAIVIPKGFLPSEDIAQINGTTEAVEGASYDSMLEHQVQIAKIIQDDSYVAYVLSQIGGGGRSLNQGQLSIYLKPRSQRPQVDQVIQELRPKLAAVPGMTVFLRNDPPIRIGGIQSKALYQFTLQAASTAELFGASQDFLAKMQQLPGLEDVTSDLQIKNPQINVVIDRDKSSALGVTANQVEDALYSAYGFRQVSTIYAPNNQYRVILELESQYQRDANALSSLYVRSKSGQLVPLSAVAKLTSTFGPLSVNHLGQLPAVTMSFNLKPGTSIGDAVNEINDLTRRSLPPTISTTFQGNALAFRSSLSGLGMLLLMAILVIYIVLGVLYESFIHPITILSGLPSAGFGALLTLELFHLAAQKGWISPLLDMDLNLYGFVGVVMLIGIVKKNAIMMIDFALEAQRSENIAPAEAIYQGCLVRFRPIMMTTMAALMGTLPIALGFGAGAESRRSLGVSVVGGLVFSQIVTLFLTPVVYIYMEDAKNWSTRLFGKKHREMPEPVGTSQRPIAGGTIAHPWRELPGRTFQTSSGRTAVRTYSNVITRRTLLRNAAVGTLAVASGTSKLFGQKGAKPPNILFILADDLGYADVSCYGRPDLKTPNIDQIAATGVRFLQAYANSAVCSATRTALITGRYQYRLRIGLEEPLAGNPEVGLPPEHPTLPSLLKKIGYGTTLIGKWHLGVLPKFGPLKSGYDHFYGFRGGALDYYMHTGTDHRDDLWDDDVQVDQMGYLTDLLGSRAVDVVNGYAKAGQPFLISLHFNAPHWPWEAPGDQAESNRLRYGDLNDFDGGTQKTYQRMIEDMDLQIGRVLGALDTHGLTDNTIVIFTSDNGGERFADTWPFTGRKTELLEGGLRIPALVRWPARIPQGRTTDQVAITMDWLPTLLAAAGTQPDPAFPSDGMNLLPMLTQSTAPVPRKLFWRYKANAQRAVRDGDYKYLKILENTFLFNVADDPMERANLKERRRDVYAKLVAEWYEWDATMLPEVDDSYTFSFGGDTLADHIGAKPTSGKADNPVLPKDSSDKSR